MNPLQAELERFLTTEERERGWVSKQRADEITEQWRLWRTGGRPG